MRRENLKKSYASFKIDNGVKKAIFIDANNEEVVAVRDDGSEADYVDWILTASSNSNEVMR